AVIRQIEDDGAGRTGADQHGAEIGVSVGGHGRAADERKTSVVSAAGRVGYEIEDLVNRSPALYSQLVAVGAAAAVEEHATGRGEQAARRVVHGHRVVAASTVEREAGHVAEVDGCAAIEAVGAAVGPGGSHDQRVVPGPARDDDGGAVGVERLDAGEVHGL